MQVRKAGKEIASKEMAGKESASKEIASKEIAGKKNFLMLLWSSSATLLY